MRKILGIAFILLFACSLFSQTERGSIYGKVLDTEGVPLPGVSVTLAGSMTGPVHFVTGPEGNFRFMTLAPGRDYSLRAALEGFKTKAIENIVVVFGQNVNVNITLEMGAISEEISVIAEKPLIDKKKTEIGLLATQEVLQQLPLPRDIWTMEKMTPGAYSRYWNIGGSESLEQDAGTARGDPDHYLTTYAIDGINVTDMSALGSTANYLNFDAIEELKIVVGGAADVSQQTSGLTTNAIMKRGGNKHSFGARFYMSDNSWQADNLTDKLRDAGITAMTRINETKDLGFNYGFPIIRDKAWFFLAYDYMEIKKFNIYNENEDRYQWSYDLKLNLQLIPQNRFEAYVRGAVARKYGDDPTPELPRGQFLGPEPRLGNPLIKLQDEHNFGDSLYVTGKYVHYGGWSVWIPMIDLDRTNLAYWNVTDRIWEGSDSADFATRPENRFQFLADYFNDSLFGVSHQLRIGGEYAIHGSETENGYAGNVLVRYDYNEPTVDYTGDGVPDIYPGIQRVEVRRGDYAASETTAYALFLQDTITYKNFNIALGLRYDYQWPEVKGKDVLAVIKDSPVWTDNFTPATINAIDNVIPAVGVSDIRAYDANGNNYRWASLSPRFSLSWDPWGNGKTVFKLSAATYYQWMGSGEASTWRRGGATGQVDFWWLDSNSDAICDFSELFWQTSDTYSLYRAFDGSGNLIGDLDDAAGIMYDSYDPSDPQKTTDPYTIVDGKAGAPRTTEIQFVVERELFTDFAVSVSGSFRRYDKWNWDLMYFPQTGQLESQDWYMSAGLPPSNIPGIGDTKDGKDHEWYVLKPEYGYTPWRFRETRPNYHIDYYGIDVIFTKRLSNRWMFNGSFTLGDQRTYFGDKGINNLTNKWAVDRRDYTTVSGSAPTSYTPGRYDNPLWMAKAMVLYQLPYGVDLSLTFNGQEGRDVRETFAIKDFSQPNPRSNSATIFMLPLGTEHSDTIALFNLRVQKRITFENFGQVAFMLDVMNLLNSDTIHWRFPKDYGTYTVQGNVFSPNPSFYDARDTFGARIARIGVRFTF